MKRYYVVGLSGYTIRPGATQAGSARLMTTYSVLDRAYCHNEVFRVTPTNRNAPDERRKELADAKCAEFNAEEARG